MNTNVLVICLLCFLLPLGVVVGWQAIENENSADISPSYGFLLYFTTSNR